jgi:hypothetical protein
MAILILYTRAGCCLCEGLEERLRALLPAVSSSASPGGGDLTVDADAVVTPLAVSGRLGQPMSALERVSLRLVDVDSDPVLQARYGLSVPVLALADGPDGSISPLPPVSPRLQGEPLRTWLLRHLGD